MVRVQRRGRLTAVVLAGTIAAGGGLAAASGAPSAGKAAQQPRRARPRSRGAERDRAPVPRAEQARRDPRRWRGPLAPGGGAGRLPGQPAQGPGRGEQSDKGNLIDRARELGYRYVNSADGTAAGAGEEAARPVRQRGDVRAERGGRRRPLRAGRAAAHHGRQGARRALPRPRRLLPRHRGGGRRRVRAQQQRAEGDPRGHGARPHRGARHALRAPHARARSCSSSAITRPAAWRSRTSTADDESGQPTPTDPEGPTSTEDGPFPVRGHEPAADRRLDDGSSTRGPRRR